MTTLPFLLHGTTLALAWFVVLNVATGVVVAIVSTRQASVPGTNGCGREGRTPAGAGTSDR